MDYNEGAVKKILKQFPDILKYASLMFWWLWVNSLHDPTLIALFLDNWTNYLYKYYFIVKKQNKPSVPMYVDLRKRKISLKWSILI